ncbi:mitochondrial arginine transporter BAC2 [Micractinium conductrix]|uniref:Mitochondrial arginine transporter BAC2 n=1 Tax=Micractinium conductrix TaxID=554055 RepID=A0A2P6VGI5_9CHLO|nr:mitochondrial arginine transporter BAC2 [Micractinium conductrix]|eukprot:PSC73209.1 mitochondrial arginine transporter BAC2 [Micractinium conductrix]
MEEGLEPAALQAALKGASSLSSSSADFLAGGFSGACGVVAGQPLDTVRIRQQAPGAGPRGAAALARHTVATEGVRSLFRGMGYPLGTSALQNAVVFQAYGAAARFLAPGAGVERSQLSLEHIFWAGCFAGVVQTAVVVPVDLLKIRLQLQTALRGSPGYVGPLSLLARTLRTERLPGLYRGTAITCVRDFPSHGVYFATYEVACELLARGSAAAGQAPSPLVLWAAGGLAGATSWLSVYPFDVIKTRMQAAAASLSPYKGWLDCARQSYAAEGGAVFFRGLSTTLGRAFLVNGAIFTAFEAAQGVLLGRSRAGVQAAAAAEAVGVPAREQAAVAEEASHAPAVEQQQAAAAEGAPQPAVAACCCSLQPGAAVEAAEEAGP